MDNHYHLLVETPDGNLSIGMRQLNGVYTQAFNRRHRRSGHLFQGRFKAILIQKDTHLLEVCRYVVLNPVIAGMIERPEEWRWSSYRAMAGRGKSHPCLTTDWVLRQFSTRRRDAAAEYRRYVRGGIGRESIWSEIKGQALMGEDSFVESFVDHLTKHRDISEIPKSQRFLHRPVLEKIFTGKDLKDKAKRDKKIAEAVEKYGYSQRTVADHLGMHFSSVSRILRRLSIMSRK